MFYYKDLLALGFERIDCNDEVFFDQNGFNYFIMHKELRKGISLEWDIHTHEIRVLRCSKSGDILYQEKITSKEMLNTLISLLEKN